MVNDGRYRLWIERKLRQRKIFPTQMRVGGIYVFMYEPDAVKDPDFMPQDMLPLVMITRPRMGGIMGINIMGLETRYRRAKVIDAIADISATKSVRDMIRKLVTFETTVKSSPLTAPAYKYWSKNRIKGRIVEVTPQELLDLLDKRII